MAVFFFAQTVLLTVEFSETRKHEREMAESNVLLESLSRVKSEFFSNISHEIKTPLTVIATDISLTNKYIRRGEYDEALQLLDDAQTEVMHTADFVTDALRFARNQEAASKMEYFDFDTVIKTTVAVFKPFANIHGNTIEIEADEEALRGEDGTPLLVYGNADTLGNAVVNLLTNANSHTKNGRIRVSATAFDEWMILSVRDNGTGIPPALLPHVFERGVTDGGGTGLGLAIVKSIVEQHGGEVSLKSEWGQGTTVRFTLPVQKEAPP